MYTVEKVIRFRFVRNRYLHTLTYLQMKEFTPQKENIK
ncbi:hypothetical protein KP77_11770 [Jeotgalibacillus alimentarius]|uniref:Uncharacterized protein n=1 Tax=Jeotgalibacillus alimentarius TaxID=135826 RepID=A0A0C2RN33_9BACL|nr:hypothetical protein KP77_11770 [Jeotgalibacillus alimentarius]